MARNAIQRGWGNHIRAGGEDKGIYAASSQHCKWMMQLQPLAGKCRRLYREIYGRTLLQYKNGLTNFVLFAALDLGAAVLL